MPNPVEQGPGEECGTCRYWFPDLKECRRLPPLGDKVGWPPTPELGWCGMFAGISPYEAHQRSLLPATAGKDQPSASL